MAVKTADEFARERANRDLKTAQKSATKNVGTLRDQMKTRQGQEMQRAKAQADMDMSMYKLKEREMYKAQGLPKAEYDKLLGDYRAIEQKAQQSQQAVKDLASKHAQESNTFEQNAGIAAQTGKTDWNGTDTLTEDGETKEEPKQDNDQLDNGQSDNDQSDNDQSDADKVMTGGLKESEPAKGQDNTQDNGQSDNDQNQQGNGQGNNMRFSETFMRDVGAAFKGQPGGNLFDAESATSKEQGKNAQNAAARHGMEAQQSQQIANQNKFAEAGKIASVQNDAQDRQNIANKEGISGAAAALQRSTNAPNVQAQEAREDAQRTQAAERRTEQSGEEKKATGQFGQAEQFRVRSRDLNNDINTEDRLSKGEGTGEPDNSAPQEEPKDEEPKDEEPKDEEPKPAQEPEPEPAQEPEPAPVSGNPQHVLNYITYGNDPTSKNYQQKAMSDDDIKLWESWGKPEPLSEQDVANVQGGFDGNIGQLQQVVKDKRPDFYQQYASSDLGKSRGIDTANQKNIGSGLTQEELDNASQTVSSDRRLKDIISDARMKFIKEDWDNGENISPNDFMFLLQRIGKFKHSDRDYDAFEDDIQDESVLNAYADHIRNYLYKYKPEATQVDKSIDPNEEHIGPMAQDIEKVNPALIKETPEGVKTVDASRLALMNAGAIADLARQMQELTDKLKALGV